MRRIVPFAFASLVVVALANAAPAEERPSGLARLAEPAGLARFLGDVAADTPLVILLPDALGDDGRAEPYAEALLARGIASLVLGLGEDPDSPVGTTDPAAAPAAVAPALHWAQSVGFDAERIGLLGFGLGGRAALAGSAGQPVAALYPGCRALPANAAAAALILQGGDQAEDCDTLAEAPGRQVEILPGVGHAWDAPGAIWPSPGPVLPDPAGTGRLRARADLAATLAAAERIADWFEALLLPRARSAGR